MTNEEKARKIGEFFDSPYLAALEMAEWKDEQAKESLKKFYDKGLELGKSIAKQQFKEYMEKKSFEYAHNRNAHKFNACNEIINELFGGGGIEYDGQGTD